MKKLLAILTCASVTLLSGCYDYTDVENLAYVTAIAIDEDNESYEYCFQFVNPLSEEGDATTYSAKGASLQEAIGAASKELTRKISFTHIKLVAVSQGVAAKMDKAIEEFNSSRFYRPDIVLAVVEEDMAKSAIADINPAMEGNAARYYDLNFSSDNSISKVVTTVKDYFSNNSCVLPLISGTAVDGVAFIRNGRLVASGDSEDAMCYNLLKEGTKQSIFNNAIIRTNPPEVSDRIVNNVPDISYVLTVNVSPLTEDVNKEEVKSQLEEKLSKFLNKVTYEYKVDVFNAKGRFKRFALTQAQLKKQNETVDFNEMKIRVSVNTALK